MSSSTQKPGQVVAGRYRLERALARGGMGSVWVARHLQLDIDVAVKFMFPDATGAAAAAMRFEREAKAAARLKSPHIVQMLDYGIEGETHFIVMELLVGEGLDARIKRLRRLSISAIGSILAQACKGLVLAHEGSIVHRDLKPANIFIAQLGHEELVKVLDFGIAKAPSTAATTTNSETKTGAIVGSPHYMSPEQIVNSKAVDYRSDIWALGVITFLAITGRLPFAGKEVGQVLVEVVTGPIPRPSEIAPELGPEVDQFFEVALARDPEKRFESVKEFARALLSLGGHTISISVSGELTAPPVEAMMPVVNSASSPSLGAALLPDVGSVDRAPSGNTSMESSVSHSDLASRPRDRSRRTVFSILGIAAVAAAGGLALGMHYSSQRLATQAARLAAAAPAVAASDPAQPSTAAVAVVPVGQGIASSAAAPASPPNAPAAAPLGTAIASANTAANTPAAPAPVRRSSSTSQANASQPAKRAAGASCNPPFTIDAAGMKHAKPECL